MTITPRENLRGVIQRLEGRPSDSAPLHRGPPSDAAPACLLVSGSMKNVLVSNPEASVPVDGSCCCSSNSGLWRSARTSHQRLGRRQRDGLDLGSDRRNWRCLRPTRRTAIAPSTNFAGSRMGDAHRERLCWPHLRAALQSLWPSSTGCVCRRWSRCRGVLCVTGPTPTKRHPLEQRRLVCHP